MTEVNKSIFKKYDIRGTAQGDDPDITPEVAALVGRAFGTYLQRVEKVDTAVVGRDNRYSSYNLQRAFMDGLCSTGCHATDVGMVSTPVVYWQAVQLGNVGGVVITASHLGPEYNGFKLCVGNRNLHSEQLTTLHKMIESNDFFYGRTHTRVDQRTYSHYVHDVANRIPMARPLRVVLDAGNGTAGLFAPRLMQLWGHAYAGIYLDPDGGFPHHPANPQDAANLRDLGEKVREQGADIGLAFDGDSDRVGVLDEHGEMITADRIVALLARDMLTRNPGATVVGDVLSSQVLFDAVEAAGGKAVMAPSGHSLVKDMMREKNALLGGEMSGHIFLAENYYGFDDGYFAAGRVLQLLAADRATLSELNASLPTLYSTPEYRPHCADSYKKKVIRGVAKALKGKGKVVKVDGLRIKFPKGWGLLRASNTEPVLSMRFEGETEADALEYRDLFVEALKAFKEVGAIYL